MNRIRRINTVTLCSVDSSNGDDSTVKYCATHLKSKSSATTWNVKVPINNYNIVLQEIYKDIDILNAESSQINKVNFLTLCVNSFETHNRILKFDDYQNVKTVEFTGHIGSMKAAFQLLHKFASIRDVIFSLNDENMKCENDNFNNCSVEDFIPTETIEHLKVMVTVNDKNSKDIQMGEKNWRLDEILCLSQLVIPNLKNVDISLIASGNTYEKLRKFINNMPFLKNKYSVEISGEILTVVRRPASTIHTGSVIAGSASVALPRDNTNTPSTSYASESIQKELQTEEMEEVKHKSESSSGHNLHSSPPQWPYYPNLNANYSQACVPSTKEMPIGTGSYPSTFQSHRSYTERKQGKQATTQKEDQYLLIQYPRETMEPRGLPDGDLRLKLVRKLERSRNPSPPRRKAPPAPSLTTHRTFFSGSDDHDFRDMDLSNEHPFNRGNRDRGESMERTIYGNRESFATPYRTHQNDSYSDGPENGDKNYKRSSGTSSSWQPSSYESRESAEQARHAGHHNRLRNNTETRRGNRRSQGRRSYGRGRAYHTNH